MRDISDNKYLITQNINDDDCSFDNFLFDRNKAPKEVDALEFLSAVRELLAMLGFKVQFNGYRFLSRLVKHYMVMSDYTEDRALDRIGELYRIESDRVYANIVGALQLNKTFITRTANLLNVSSDKIESENVTDAVEAIAALFKVFYNYVTDEFDDSDELRTSPNWEKVFSYGKQKSKSLNS